MKNDDLYVSTSTSEKIHDASHKSSKCVEDNSESKLGDLDSNKAYLQCSKISLPQMGAAPRSFCFCVLLCASFIFSALAQDVNQFIYKTLRNKC
ncbi:hypothetical protein AB3S75_041494 [Citrus x aurantiifolia]